MWYDFLRGINLPDLPKLGMGNHTISLAKIAVPNLQSTTTYPQGELTVTKPEWGSF